MWKIRGARQREKCHRQERGSFVLLVTPSKSFMRTVSHHHSPFLFVLELSTRFPLQFYSPHFLAVIIRIVSLLPLIYKDTIQKKIVFFLWFICDIHIDK